MPGLFDRLNADIKARDKETGGPTALDIANLPAPPISCRLPIDTVLRL